MRSTCHTCHPPSIPERAICGAARPHMTRHAQRAGGEVRRLPAVTRHHRAGDKLAIIQASQMRAGWMPPGQGWFPCPRTDNTPLQTGRPRTAGNAVRTPQR
eukprot:2116344-Pyramimonas_sp.AAC.1